MRRRPRAPGEGAIPPDPGGKPRHERSHPKYRPDAGEPALRRQDPFRRRVPLAGGARQEALPHARRCTGIRRAKGKPERAQARPVHRGCDRRATADSGAVGGSKEAAGGDEVSGGRKRRASQYVESLISITPILRDGHGACHRARIRATRWWPPQDEVQPVETQQPHAEERATRASRSMGSKRVTFRA